MRRDKMGGEPGGDGREMATEDRPENLLRKRQAAAAAEAAKRQQRERQEQERLDRRRERALELEQKVGGPLRILVGDYNSARDEVTGFVYGDDLKGRTWIAYEKRGGDGKCRAAELQFQVQEDRTVQISATGVDFQPPPPETVALDALTPATVARHFKNFVAAARA
jgi:hypothetical protein